MRRIRRAIGHLLDPCHRDGGMSTAEYAVGTVAACGFGALLYKILTSGQVRELLVDIIQRALNVTF
ncbi:MAG: DUF4244 domain-containing protein [Streptosporangiales bacterium]|nr:DUF4244 domain-containing protein [Streptosporangiales bacterium]